MKQTKKTPNGLKQNASRALRYQERSTASNGRVKFKGGPIEAHAKDKRSCNKSRISKSLTQNNRQDEKEIEVKKVRKNCDAGQRRFSLGALCETKARFNARVTAFSTSILAFSSILLFHDYTDEEVAIYACCRHAKKILSQRRHRYRCRNL